MNESIRVINSVELIPLETVDKNPYLTKVRIKVFHLGENRNRSYIDKDTALRMAKTLRGNPIVARFRKEKGDLTDHGEEITINDEGFKVECKTRPYGFVDLNAEVWFEDFDDTDELGNVVRHTYLVTEGMIWSEYYPEMKETVLNGGRPQSMELDEKTLQGNWSNDINSNYEIFIINDAIITKLCGLGDDVEPCFLGASIEPLFTKQYSEESFVKELVELKTKFNLALQQDKGGNSMEVENKEVLAAPEVESVAPVAAPEENFNEQGKTDSKENAEIQNSVEEFKKNDEEEKEEQKNDDKEEKDDEDKKEDKGGNKFSEDSGSEASSETGDADQTDSSDEQETETPTTENTATEGEDEEDDDEEDPDEDISSKKKILNHELEDMEAKYTALEKEFNELKDKYTSLEQKNAELVAFKNAVEDKEKDALISQFYMLSDEDKKDVIENKSKYSLEDIEAKLSVICVRKKVSFSKDGEVVNAEQSPVTTFNLNSVEDEDIPAWLEGVKPM